MKVASQVIAHREERVVPFAREVFFNVIADVESYQQVRFLCKHSLFLLTSPIKHPRSVSSMVYAIEDITQAWTAQV